MLSLKVQKKDELIYLIGLEPVDFIDLSKKDAVLAFKLGDQKVSITQVSGTREEFIENVKKLSGINESTIIKP